MKKMLMAAVLVVLPVVAAAEKPHAGAEVAVQTALITAIDHDARLVTLAQPDGQEETIRCGPDVSGTSARSLRAGAAALRPLRSIPDSSRAAPCRLRPFSSATAVPAIASPQAPAVEGQRCVRGRRATRERRETATTDRERTLVQARRHPKWRCGAHGPWHPHCTSIWANGGWTRHALRNEMP